MNCDCPECISEEWCSYCDANLYEEDYYFVGKLKLCKECFEDDEEDEEEEE